MATKMTREEAINKVRQMNLPKETMEILEALVPELAESEDERIMSRIIDGFKNFSRSASKWNNIPIEEVIVYLEKQKENPKSADSIPSDCTSDAKYEDRWHKVTDSLPDNGRLVLAKDCLGNVLLARYDGENWEVNVYDNEDHYCHNSISKWCEIPSEKQKEQKPIVTHGETYHVDTLGTQQVIFGKMPQKPADFRREAAKDILCAIISATNGATSGDIAMAIEIADKLIKQLKEENNEGRYVQGAPGKAGEIGG